MSINRNITILIVEDEAITAIAIKGDLEKTGYSICAIVSSGKKAIVEAVNHNPDFILMDIRLPGQMDGIDDAEKIKEYINSRILFMSGYDYQQVLTLFAFFSKDPVIYPLFPPPRSN